MAKALSERYLRMWGPTILVLRELGGSGTPKEVIPIVLEKLGLSEEELAEVTATGAAKADNEVRWAASDMRVAGLLQKDTGVWILAERGWTEVPNIEQARAIRHKLQKDRKAAQLAAGGSEVAEEETPEEVAAAEVQSVDEQLHAELLAMSPSGFERFCQLLLRKAGFEEVHVTGKSGDGGIDGYGTMRLSPFMSFHMIFQCKKYKGSVGPDTVRQMRGSMDGRTDKGLIVTTGTFTKEAHREGSRQGVKQVELVDGEALIELMKRFELGTEPVIAHKVVYDFFAKYRD